MKIRSLKTVYGILLSLLLLAGTVHATTLSPASGTTLAATTINRAYTSTTFTAGRMHRRNIQLDSHGTSRGA